jgi:glycosyltransferase involved in cell wall biosynthesis
MFNYEFPPLGGGTGTVNKEILKQFRNHPEIKIDLITSTRGKEREFEEFAENINIYKYPVNNQDIHSSSNRELITYTWHALWAAFKLARKEKYDMSMIWCTLPAGPIGFLLKLFFRIPYMVRVSGSDIPGFSIRFKWVRYLSPMLKRIWRSSSITIGKCQKEVSMLSAIDSKSTFGKIENGIDSSRFQPKQGTRQAHEPIRVICVARLIPRKGVPILIQAADILHKKEIPLHVSLVGSGEEEEKYKAMVQTLGLEEVVHFDGYVPREKMGQKYAESDAFVLPSYNEGMSNAVLEAMAAGLPVIVTPTGGTDELVTQGENGFIFDFDDSETLASQIEILANDPVKSAAMGKAARKRAEAQDWGTIAGAYELLWKEVTQ